MGSEATRGEERAMSLIQKKTTPRLHAANRANSLKSTGPQTKLGKAHSSRNALKFGVFARVTEPLMDSDLIPSQEDLRGIMDTRLHLKGNLKGSCNN